MAAPTLCKLLAPIPITATTNGISITDSGGAATASVTAGTYYWSDDGTSSDMVAALKTALDAAGSDTWTVALNATTHKLSFDCDGGLSGAWAVDWDNAATTIDTTLLGIADTSAAFGDAPDTPVTLDYAARAQWYSTNPPARDEDGDEFLQAQSTAASGRVWTMRHGAKLVARELAFSVEPQAQAVPPDTGSVGLDWRTALFPYLQTDSAVRYYPDVGTASDFYKCHADEATASGYRPVRHSPGVALYSWATRWIGTEAELGAGNISAIAPVPTIHLKMEEAAEPYVDTMGYTDFEDRGTGAGLTQQVAGVYGYGIKSDGQTANGSLISKATPNAHPQEGEFSACMRVYIPTAGGTGIGALWSCGYSAGKGVLLYCHNTGGPYNLRLTKPGEELYSGGVTLLGGQFNFVAWSISDANQYMRLWIDNGSGIAMYEDLTNTTATTWGDAYTQIGAYSGTLDNVVWDNYKYESGELWTTAEVAALASGE